MQGKKRGGPCGKRCGVGKRKSEERRESTGRRFVGEKAEGRAGGKIRKIEKKAGKKEDTGKDGGRGRKGKESRESGAQETARGRKQGEKREKGGRDKERKPEKRCRRIGRAKNALCKNRERKSHQEDKK